MSELRVSLILSQKINAQDGADRVISHAINVFTIFHVIHLVQRVQLYVPTTVVIIWMWKNERALTH